MILKTVKALVAGPYAIGIAATLGGCASDLPVDRLQTSQASHSFSPRVEIIDSPELASAGPMLVGWSTATGERSAHRYAPTATATEGGAVAQLAQLVVGDATPVVAPAMEMPPQLAEHAAVFDPDRSVQRTRGYITIRYGRALTGDSELATGYSYDGNGHHELLGASAGFNWGRYLGAELAVDNYEPAVRSDGIGVIGEYSASSVILQGRLRYPLLDGRLSPYIVGGAGIALTEFNDRTALGAMPLIGDFTGKEIIPAYSIGAGADYFIADNISIGGEGKYIFLKPEATSGGRVQTIDVSALMLGATLRLYFPGLPFEGSNDASARGDWSDLDWSQIHPYFGFRLGVPVFLDTQLTPEFEMPGKERQQLSSAIFGVDINRYFGAELTIDYSETDVDAIAVSSPLTKSVVADSI